MLKHVIIRNISQHFAAIFKHMYDISFLYLWNFSELGMLLVKIHMETKIIHLRHILKYVYLERRNKSLKQFRDNLYILNTCSTIKNYCKQHNSVIVIT